MIPYQYALYSSEEAMNLYLAFLQIPDNRFSFEVPSGFIVTSDMMNTMILASYNAKEPINVVA